MRYTFPELDSTNDQRGIINQSQSASDLRYTAGTLAAFGIPTSSHKGFVNTSMDVLLSTFGTLRPDQAH